MTWGRDERTPEEVFESLKTTFVSIKELLMATLPPKRTRLLDQYARDLAAKLDTAQDATLFQKIANLTAETGTQELWHATIRKMKFRPENQ